jgi:hypothetical protein
MSKDYSKITKQWEDAVDFEYDAYAEENMIFSPSPYLNWIFANRNHGLPKGAGILAFAPEKTGKSLLIQAFIQELHQRDKEAVAVVQNTEMRGFLQGTKGLFKGIDKKRLIIFDSNRPEDVFDRFADEIYPMIEDGSLPVGLYACDSLTAVGGTKAEGRSVNDHLVGDKALTKSKGLDRIIPLLKKKRIPHIFTEQMRTNIITNGQPGPADKSAATWNTKHTFEYFIKMAKAGAKEDKVDLKGEAFVNEAVKDARGEGEAVGHKIYFKMDANSLGPAGRSGVVYIDYKKGIENLHEEIFLLGYNTGVIKREGNSIYVHGDVKVNGKGNFALKIKEDPALGQAILAQVKALDSDKN